MNAEGTLTRRGLRHTLLRKRNERIAELRDTRLPAQLIMSHATLTDVLVDSDPAEARVVDFEGKEFMGIPVLTDDRLPLGEVRIVWPAGDPASDPTEL